jgi:hypothetical protein
LSALLAPGIGVTPGFASDISAHSISGPYAFKNLSVFLIHDEDNIDDENVLSLSEGIDKKLVTVRETGTVSQLEIENLSDRPVFIPAGCIIKGGRQDRMVRKDVIIEPNSGKQPLPTFCVERGRWTARHNQAGVEFETAPNVVADKEIKLAMKKDESQGGVWENVQRFEQNLSANIRGGRAGDASSPTSLALMLENDEVRDSADAYYQVISALISVRPKAIGMAFAINDSLNSADLYGNGRLFEQFLPELLRAAAIEAVAKGRGTDGAGALAVEDVQQWLAATEDAVSTHSEIVGNVYLTTSETESMISVESYKYGPGPHWLHKSVISK